MGKVVDCEISETVPAVPAGRRTQDPPVKADRSGKTYGKDTGYMKRSKRWAALFMTLCLLAGLMAVPVRAADVTQLEQELAAAKAALEAATKAKPTVEAEADVSGKQTAVETAKTAADIEGKQNVLEEKKGELKKAQDALTAAGESPDSSLTDAVAAAEGAVREAEKALEDAEATVQEAEDALAEAQDKVAKAQKAIDDAQKAVTAKEKELEEAKKAQTPEPAPKPTAKVDISISPSSIDFGSLTKGTTSGLTKSFTITNNSDYTTRIGVSGSLTNATYSLSSSDLSKGSSCTVTVMVTSTSSTGSIGGKLTVSAAINDAQAGSDSSTTSVSVSGKIVDEKYTLSLSPTSKDFGKLVEGYEEKTAKEKELTVTVTNKSDNTVRMGDVKGNDHFTVTATQSGTISLKYNEDVTYKIVPKQGLKAGSYTDKIVFQTREGATAEFKATLVVEKKEAALTLSPSTLEFGSAQQGYTPVNYQTVTIKNNTDYPMTLEQPSSYNYEIGLLSNKSLPAGGTATFTIRPMTGLMANSYNGKITVRANGYSADLSVNFTVTANLMLLTFLDVPNGYSLAADIAYVTQRGLMNGTGNGNFTPYGPTTRGQIVTILHRLAGQPVVVGTGFTDVAAGSYCENAVKWAAAIGITKGYEDGTFKPGDPITREQMATFLFRYASTRNLTTALRADLNKFPDGDSVSAYARDALAWANGAGLVNGTGEGTLNPSGGATRAQAAAILHRFCENVAR